MAFPSDNHVVRFCAWVQDCQTFWRRPLIGRSCHIEARQFRTEETMENNSTRSAKTKVSGMTGYPALSRGAPPWQQLASSTAPAGDAGLRLRPCSSLSSDTLGDERRQPSGRWYDRLPRKPAKAS